MTDLRKRVGDAMQATKPRANGHVMFEDVRDAAIRAVLAWAPMTSAPKDGSPVLLSDGYDAAVCTWHKGGWWKGESRFKDPECWHPVAPPPTAKRSSWEHFG